MRYLSSKQALFDLANFVTNYTDSLPNGPYKIFTIGGSYSGALSGMSSLFEFILSI